MAKCAWCGKKFNVSDTREEYDNYFEGLEYDDDYPDNNICLQCASTETSGNIGIGEEIMEDMGSHNWND